MKKRRKIMRLVDWIICVFTKTKLSPKIERRAAQNELGAKEREREAESKGARETYIYTVYVVCVIFMIG